jgi:hypothetical protein
MFFLESFLEHLDFRDIRQLTEVLLLDSGTFEFSCGPNAFQCIPFAPWWCL